MSESLLPITRVSIISIKLYFIFVVLLISVRKGCIMVVGYHPSEDDEFWKGEKKGMGIWCIKIMNVFCS